MQLVLDQQKSGDRHKSRLQERFDKLRSRLERQRRLDVRFRQDLDELVETFHRRSLERDQLVFDDLVALTEKLIVFAGRKSLSDWHRAELDEWLRDLIERRIPQLDRRLAERLRLDYRQAIASSMDISVDELVARLEADSEDVETELGQGGSGEQADDSDDGPSQEDLFGFDDVDSEPEAFDAGFDAGFDADGPEWMDDEDEAHLGRTVMDGCWAKDLFRRAAQALHPDREPDPEQRQAKQARMRDLLRARRHGDVMAMLTLYSDCVGGADIVLAEQEMTEVCATLEQQLEVLESEQQEYIYSHPVRHMVFDLFYHSTKKGRQRRLGQWERELEHEAADLRDLVAFLRNLSCLKSVLADRRNERAAVFADILFEDV